MQALHPQNKMMVANKQQAAKAAAKAVPARVRRSQTVQVSAQAQTALTVASPTAVAPVPAPAPSRAHLSVAAQMSERHNELLSYFPVALGVDDFISRVEIALAGFGFTGDNTIAHTNLCRDEVTQVVKDKIETVYGASFNTNGLGAILTCGVTGIKAGLSHSPVCTGGRERYVFFSFPHIAINSDGEVGALARPGRPKQSCACGALIACLGSLKAEGVEAACKTPGDHDPLEPELSILKQRLARRVRYESLDPTKMSLVDITHLAERTITNDIEYLIEKAVDTKKANYAVITGVQIHNWGKHLNEGGDASIEFVAPAKCYTVVNGLKTYIDLPQVPALSPRQIQTMSTKSFNGISAKNIQPGIRGSIISEVPLEYLVKKLGGSQLMTDGSISAPSFASADQFEWPTWQSRIRLDNNPNRLLSVERDQNAPTMDSPEPAVVHPSFVAPP